MVEKKRSAAHEALHAISAYCCGLRIKRLTIEGPIEETSPFRLGTPSYCELSVRSRGSLERMTPTEVKEKLLIYLAPAILGNSDEEMSIGNINDILEFLNYLAWPVQEPEEIRRLVDLAKRTKLKYPDDPRKQAFKFFRKNKETVERFMDLPQVKEAHKSLTNLLLQRGSLSGFEVASHLEQFILPGKPLPLRDHYCPPVGVTPEVALEGARRLCQIAVEVLAAGPVIENPECEKGRAAVLQAVFKLEEIISSAGPRFIGAK